MTASRPVVGIGGLGYMGLATGLGFAHRGVSVLGYELRADVRTALRRGRTPIFEPGLPQLLRAQRRNGRFDLVDSWDELAAQSDVIYLCLPTPARPDGRIDIGPLRAGTTTLAKALQGRRDYRLVVVKSTVVPGTTEGVVRPLLEKVSGRNAKTLGVAANPEFLAEGSMVRDATSPDRIVLGTSNRRDERILRRVYSRFPSELVVLSPTEAELTKYFLQRLPRPQSHLRERGVASGRAGRSLNRPGHGSGGVGSSCWVPVLVGGSRFRRELFRKGCSCLRDVEPLSRGADAPHRGARAVQRGPNGPRVRTGSGFGRPVEGPDRRALGARLQSGD